MVQQIVFVDVDDTMVRCVGAKRIPMPAVIAQVRRLKSEGASLFLLSSGGAEYCRTTAIELGLSECFDGYLPKPTAYIDDQPVHEWRFCKHLYPSQAESVQENMGSCHASAPENLTLDPHASSSRVG